MDYEKLIEKLSQKGSVPGLESISALLDRLGHPERELNIVHIAGTNGKGSVFAYLSSILQEGGYRIGRYISPTITCYEERFQVNGAYISKEKLSKLYEVVEEAIEKMVGDGLPSPTLFEAETALSFLYFKEEETDYALIETGMGGRLDATNIIEHPLLTIISSVSMDHMAFLGDTIEAIAQEKAGIIKTKTPVVLEENDEKVCEVIAREAKRKNAPLVRTDKEQYIIIEETCEGTSFWYKGTQYVTSLPGIHQVSNAVTAINALEIMQRMDQKLCKSITIEDVTEGIKNTKWAGRLELLSKNPYFYRDGAHNPDAALKLKLFLEKHFTNRRIIYIMGILKDKEYDKMLKYLMPLAAKAYIFKPDNPRGLEVSLLAKAMETYDAEVISCTDVKQAGRYATAQADSEDVIVAWGSLSFMEEMDDCFR